MIGEEDLTELLRETLTWSFCVAGLPTNESFAEAEANIRSLQKVMKTPNVKLLSITGLFSLHWRERKKEARCAL